MKKILLSSSVILAFVFYIVYQKVGATDNNTLPPVADVGGTQSIPAATNTTQNPAPSSNPTPTLAPAPITTPKPTPIPAGQYKDGTFTGSVADAFYGNVQVQAIIQGGKLIDVKFLDYPQDRGTSARISNQSLPQLKTEAIQSQNAKVNIISGATQTSQGFIQSLSSALALAKN